MAAAAAAAQVLETFHPFPRLPDELRLAIWTHAACEPRTVAVHEEWEDEGATELNYLYTRAARTPFPIVIHVNHEARTQALTIFTRAFEVGSHPRYTYVNFDLDTINFDAVYLKAMLPAERAKVRRLCLTVWNVHGPQVLSLDSLKDMSSLRELEIIALNERYPFYNSTMMDDAYNGDLTRIRRLLEAQFGHIEGWVFPKLRLMQTGKLWEWKEGPMGPPTQIMDRNIVRVALWDDNVTFSEL